MTREVYLVTRSGEDLYGVLNACLVPTGIGKGRVMIGIVDTTELRHAKDLIERERERYRALVFNMPMAFLRVKSDALRGYDSEIGLFPGMDVFAFMAANPKVLEHAGSLCFIEEANLMLGAVQPCDLAGMSISFAWKARPDTLITILAAGVEGAEFQAETQMNTLHDTNVRARRGITCSLQHQNLVKQSPGMRFQNPSFQRTLPILD